MLSSARALDLNIPVCCACVPVGSAPPASAVFCAAALDQNTSPLVDRCIAEPGDAKLLCVARGNATCPEQLSEAGVDCPEAAHAPVISPLNLGTLALALGATGAFLLRRRRTRG